MTDASGRVLTADALKRLHGMKNRRMRRITESLIRHVHDFVRDVKPTEAEWMEAIRFLTQTGHKSDGKRQEFILLSDVLGVSMLVDAINHRAARGATESTVLGPFHVNGTPFLPKGANISKGRWGVPTVVSGHVLSVNGRPIRGAVLDVWQTAGNGLYDVQDPKQPPGNLRGRFRTGVDGSFSFRTVKPVSYPVPTDGPVGRLLRQMGRHPYRPAHLHFKITAKGHEPLTTHLFVKGDPYLESDAVFGVKPSLVVEFRQHRSAAEAKRLGVRAPFCTVSYDFGLEPVPRARSGRS
jgi:protocatechuate 3,4-dioxygenase beta subunit